jgi:hypothetical protein
MRINIIKWVGLLMLVVGQAAWADTSVDDFLGKAFPGVTPASHVLWLQAPVRSRALAVLGHEYVGMRVKYWVSGSRTAWVLDEIGKERPITLGVVVEGGHIRALSILAYRESRGSEVGQAFFLRQFTDAALGKDDRLNHDIDGITGATLSVAAVGRMARLALVFDQTVGATP